MAIKKYDICKPIKYGENNDKTFWANVGKMTEFTKDDGSVSRIIEIPAIGLKANIFPVKPRQEAKNASGRTEMGESEVDTDLGGETQPDTNSGEGSIPF